jgi:hypothetical protein
LYWSAIASSSDGTKLVATVNGGYIYTSIDSGATWNQQTSFGPQIWTTVSSSSDGTKLVAAAYYGYLYASPNSGGIWKQQTVTLQQSWAAVASSSDGTKLVAAGTDGSTVSDGDGYIYTSTDSGATWVEQTSLGYGSWTAVASSSDGTKLVAVDEGRYMSGGYIYTSADSGASWKQQTNAGSNVWTSVSSSSDGTKLVAGTYGDWIYTSSDSGVTWTPQTNSVQLWWQSVASSSDGTKLIAAATDSSGYGHIYTSTDSGATWTLRPIAGTENLSWSLVASSSDGTKLAAALSNAWIYTSTDSGVSWKQRKGAGSRSWQSLASSSDGTKLVAAADYICTSTDSGATWTQQVGAGQQSWQSVACSSDGTKVIAATEGDGIWTGSVSTSPPSIDTPTISSVTTSKGTLGATIESIGGSPITAAGVAYGTSMNPDTTGNKESTTVTSGAFTVDVTGLSSNTLYHFRGYATNSQGTSYTDDTTFTTVAGAPTATAATGLSETGFTANWTAPSGTATITNYQLDVATDFGFTSFVSGYNNFSVSGASTSAAVTGLSSGTYYYRVRAVNAGGTSANSNTEKVVFTVPPPPPTITVTSPSGGEMWTATGKYTITWTYTGNPGSKVKILLLQGGSPVATITSSASIGKAGSGSYAWTTPATLVPGSNYEVQVTSATNSSYTATSASDFTIAAPTIALTSPNGATWNAGGKYQISWSYTGNPGNSVKITLLGGSTPIVITKSTSIGKTGAGSYTWTIPNTEATGSDYTVTVSSTTISSCTTKSNTFTINGPTLNLNAPSNGSWSAGAKCPIDWSYTGNPGNIEIDLLQNGLKVSTIKSSTSAGSKGTGSYSWTIPKTQAAGDGYAVMIKATANNSIFSIGGAFSFTSLTASAGPDQKVSESAVVKLSGSNSIIQSTGAASYLWTQLDGPAVTLSSPNAVETGLVAPDAGSQGKSLRFQLSLTGTDGAKSKDSCIVNVVQDNTPPIADAGPNQAVAAFQIVELDGSRSSAGDTGTLSYSWRQISGVAVTLSDPSAAQPTFVAPDVDTFGTSLVFELTVTDQAGLRARDTCIVNVVSDSRPPKAQAGPNQTVSPGSRVVLDGSSSTDEEGGIVSYTWRQIAGPPITLSDPTAIKPEFSAPVIDAPEDLVFELTVTDPGGLQDKAKVVITVVSGTSVK